MTDSLRDALWEAANDGHGSGATGRDLLRRGRRKARLRRVSGTTAGGLALAALIAIPFAPGLLSDSGNDLTVTTRSPATRTIETDIAMAGFQVRSLAQLEGVCTNIEGFEDWTIGAGVQDQVHTTAILVSPNGQRWSTCGGSTDGESYGAYVTSGSEIDDDPGYNWMRVNSWWDGCETGADPRVCVWASSGQVPSGVARMTFEQADGQTSKADVRNGFFAWQSEVDSIDVFNQPLWVTLYNVDGDRIDRLNFNRDPDIW